MNEIVEGHRQSGIQSLQIAVLTISDTRTLETDASGDLIVELAEAAGHVIKTREIISDDPEPIRGRLERYRANHEIHAALLTGGTGISPRDQTYETVSALLTRSLPGYGELFRMLSYAEIGSACLMSRALGGLVGELVVLVMPGSRAGVKLAMTRIILPELTHMVQQARKR